MKIENDISDALTLIRELHSKIREIEKTADELQYLIYSLDDRVKIEFWREYDKRGSEEGIKAD